MGVIEVRHSGSFANLEKFLRRNEHLDIDTYLHKFAQKGVEALSEATPVDTGLTAASWRYEIEKNPQKQTIKITWLNDNVVDEWFNVALMLQYGHATGTGYWVEGVDYINPAMKSIFDKLAEEVWEEVNKV